MRAILYASLAIAVLLIQISGDPMLLTGPETVADPLGTGADKGNPFTLNSIIGAIFVFVFYWIKFSEWPGPGTPPAGFQHQSTRHSTTWVRYTCWGVTYAGFMVAAYFSLIVFPQVLINFVQNLSDFGDGGDFLNLITKLWQSPMRPEDMLPSSTIDLSTNEMVPYAVIVTTIVWAGAFSDFDRGFRRTIQQHALIPAEAQRLIDKFEQQSEVFTPDTKEAKKILDERSESLIDELDFSGSKDSLSSKYARAEYVYYRLSRMAMERVYSKVLTRYRQEQESIKDGLKGLRSELHQFRADQIDYLNSLKKKDGGREEEGDPPASNTADLLVGALPLRKTLELMEGAQFKLDFVKNHFSQQYEKIAADVDSMLRSLYQVAVCTALAVGKSPGQRRALFGALGFRIADTMSHKLGRNTIVLVIVVLAVSTFAPSFIYYAATKLLELQPNRLVPQDIGEVLQWTFHGSLMHLLAFCAAYLVQRGADQKRELRRRYERRHHARIADYTECFLGGFSINIFLFAVIFLVSGKLTELHSSWPWALVPGVTAAYTVYFMHNLPSTAASCWGRAALQGLWTGLAAALAILLAFDIPVFISPSDELLIFTLYVVVTTFFLGLGLGAVIQQWIKAVGLPSGVNRRASVRKSTDAVGEWSSGGANITVHIQDISMHGVAINEELPQAVGSTGMLTLADGDVRPAKVVRQDEREITCLEFVREETPDLVLIPAGSRWSSREGPLMSKFVSVLLVAVTGALLSLAHVAPVAAAGSSLVIGVRADAPPFSWRTGEGEIAGFSFMLCEKIAQRAIAAADYTRFELKVVNARSRFDALRNGEIDILCGATTVTLERMRPFDFTLFTFLSGASYMYLENSEPVRVEELDKKRIGVLRETTTEDLLRHQVAQMLGPALDPDELAIVPIDDHFSSIEMLEKDEIDVYFADREVLLALRSAARKRSKLGLRVADRYLSYEPYALAVRRDESDLLFRANQTLSAMFRDKSIFEIFRLAFPGKAMSKSLEQVYLLQQVPEGMPMDRQTPVGTGPALPEDETEIRYGDAIGGIEDLG